MIRVCTASCTGVHPGTSRETEETAIEITVRKSARVCKPQKGSPEIRFANVARIPGWTLKSTCKFPGASWKAVVERLGDPIQVATAPTGRQR